MNAFQQQLSINDKSMTNSINIPAPTPLTWDNSEVCVLYWLPEILIRIEPQLPTLVTYIGFIFFSVLLSCSPNSVYWDHYPEKSHLLLEQLQSFSE